MTGAELDRVTLAFEPGSLVVLNVVLALVMVGVALDLRPRDFAAVLRHPRAAVVGLLGQVVVLPALTFALVLVVRPPASVALGMILVAACPGGNMSNFITHLARGNTELSVTLTAIGTVLAVVTTPLNLAFGQACRRTPRRWSARSRWRRMSWWRRCWRCWAPRWRSGCWWRRAGPGWQIACAGRSSCSRSAAWRCSS
ncbi:bile acid:sodium symporter family protein [Nannocystis pusilla]|uniref:bile acid:sodium symporter family protein n=1 Tax=Nannocystis pusilla TaxID=889268 RepID=UPI003B7B3366